MKKKEKNKQPNDPLVASRQWMENVSQIQTGTLGDTGEDFSNQAKKLSKRSPSQIDSD